MSQFPFNPCSIPSALENTKTFGFLFLRDIEVKIEMELEMCYALFWYMTEKLIKDICEGNQ